MALANLQADELEFMDPEHRSTIVAEEVVIRNGAIPAGGGVKLITWIRRRQDLDLAAAQDYWCTNHAAVADRIPGLARYVQNHARPGPVECEMMGLPMTWFGSIEQVRANATSPELATTRADEPNFLQPDLPFVLVREHHII
ncbi:MAG: EthD family reductase [Actinomycetota bacterium]|nr:EthD family reductase [Actinomycetota bacterium]